MINNNFYYVMPTKIYYGSGFISALQDIIGKHRKVMLITGKMFLKKTGWLAKIKAQLKGNHIMIFGGIYENPDVRLIEAGVDAARKFAPDYILGVGGGSVLDSAKAIAVLANNQGRLIAYLDKKILLKKPGIRMIAIPTTAGSSSEVTPYSAITVRERGVKITLAGEYLYPDYAVLDPNILNGMPKEQIANSGIDVLCHAIESYWSKSHNPISDVFAIESIRLVFNHLINFYEDHNCTEAASGMLKASMYAGLAFSNTKTTACHSMSYPLTANYGVPHGQACAVTLPAVLLFNKKNARERILDIAEAIGTKTAESASMRIKALMRSIGLKVKLRYLGIKRNDIKDIIAKGFSTERIKNNPRQISREDMESILGSIY